MDPTIQALIDACIIERRYEQAVRGKDWDDAMWAHYIASIQTRRQAVDGIVERYPGEQATQQEGMGL